MVAVVVRLQEQDVGRTQARELCAALLNSIAAAAPLVPVHFSCKDRVVLKRTQAPETSTSDLVKHVIDRSEGASTEKAKLGSFQALSEYVGHSGDVVLLASTVPSTWFADGPSEAVTDTTAPSRSSCQSTSRGLGASTARPHVVLLSFGHRTNSASPHALSDEAIARECNVFGGTMTRLDLASTYTQLKRAPSIWQQDTLLRQLLPNLFLHVENVRWQLMLGSLMCSVAPYPPPTTAPPTLALQLRQLSLLQILGFTAQRAFMMPQVEWSTGIYLLPSANAQDSEHSRHTFHLLAEACHQRDVVAIVALGPSVGILSLPADYIPQTQAEPSFVMSVLADEQHTPAAQQLLSMYSGATGTGATSTNGQQQQQQQQAKVEGAEREGRSPPPSFLAATASGMQPLHPTSPTALSSALRGLREACAGLPQQADRVAAMVDELVDVGRVHAMPSLHAAVTAILTAAAEQHAQQRSRTRNASKVKDVLEELLARVPPPPTSSPAATHPQPAPQ
ncbi:hypothetical protein PTSG_08189 [Salpingoeca rosetta]|uniref:Uncharacterized protein n=1 Tax=Salpingoeca rosetta (strain ATCC 50818 / BSB-021) TaxID=946362 RepID=F2UI93_SALR5|nr:uncharacterized protein PTSG_08189 [Salpingoeca rosetta]EGD76842.1 hypothetical protein PTSG_08189 [Salpingoeca rosetta]|eukprot:XP_004991214.1 hypothetical protein PTSG_08189 [Salpingoeca rosetta]